MADSPLPTVAVNLPADLVARIEDVKRDREEDRNRSLEQIVKDLCQEYVTVREMARWESAHQDELNRSYEEDPNDWYDARSLESHA